MGKINKRGWLVAALDLVLMAISYLGSVLLFGYAEPKVFFCTGLLLVLFFVSMLISRLYHTMWRFSHVFDFVKLTGYTMLACGFFDAIAVFGLGCPFSLAFCAFQAMVAVYILIFVRVVYRVYIRQTSRESHAGGRTKRLMIVGAGVAASYILNEITYADSPYMPICMIDDDKSKLGKSMMNIPIVGTTADIAAKCDEYAIDSIIFAIPSCSAADRTRILNLCYDTKRDVKTIPFLHNLFENRQFMEQIKDVEVEDLLGREPINFDFNNVIQFVKGKTCMVTGGGGSIGSELCRQLAKCGPAHLIILDIYENNAYDVQQELIREYGDRLQLTVEIASVRDYAKLDLVFKKYKPQLVFHAAAHKHVPLMEGDPEEAIKNNVVGTLNTAILADKYKSEKFILISTDKAVNPTNVMGASKRCCEMIIQYLSQQPTYTVFAAVRFGNVLGSNGSVVPLFKRQIEKGGPVTVTHPDIIRFFMTIPEAVSLVLEAGRLAQGGEIFVLDMGEPVKVLTLAENMIRMSGYEPYKDIDIQFIGLRPGEKLYEEILMDEEGLTKTDNNRIFIGKQVQIDPIEFPKELYELKQIALRGTRQELLDKLAEVVPTFHHKGE